MKNTFALYSTITKEKFLVELQNYGLVFLGSLILSVSYAIFIVPHHIVPGGILGLSIVLSESLGFSVGMIAICINIPLLLWGTKILGGKAGLKTAFSMVLVSSFIDAVTLLTQGRIFVEDILVSSIFGGILIGFAVSIVMSAGATTGGNDILVRMLMKKIKLPYNQLILIIDGSVVLLGVLTYRDYTMAAYCVIAIVAISKTIESFIKKNDQNKTILIFSQHNILIEKEILRHKTIGHDLVQLIHQDSEQKMILITKKNKKLTKLTQLIYQIDPDAHIIELESNLSLS
jgi:uncharacterized membrane-anchored protein YitT (DUF2179 family)